MSKMIKTFEDKSYSLNTGFTKDLGLFKVNATVWSYATYNESKKVYEHEINDVELAYYINDQYCKYQGFKELYEKLYGVDSFKEFEQDITYEFQEAYHDQTTLK